MTDPLSGFRDKLYWRRSSGMAPSGVLYTYYHCFRSVGRLSSTKNAKTGAKYVSLCGAHKLQRSGGQGCERPLPMMRCSICDGAEMDRRGWDESGPAS